jgi:hypothetical protein
MAFVRGLNSLWLFRGPTTLTDVILLDVLDEVDQGTELQAAFVELTNVQQEYSHNLFIFKSKELLGVCLLDLDFDVDFSALKVTRVKCSDTSLASLIHW